MKATWKTRYFSMGFQRKFGCAGACERAKFWGSFNESRELFWAFLSLAMWIWNSQQIVRPNWMVFLPISVYSLFASAPDPPRVEYRVKNFNLALGPWNMAKLQVNVQLNLSLGFAFLKMSFGSLYWSPAGYRKISIRALRWYQRKDYFQFIAILLQIYFPFAMVLA